MTSKKRLKPGEARVQYHAIKPELDELLSKGHTLKGAYNILKESKNISLSYEALYRNFAGITPERAKIKRKQEIQRGKPNEQPPLKAESEILEVSTTIPDAPPSITTPPPSGGPLRLEKREENNPFKSK